MNGFLLFQKEVMFKIAVSNTHMHASTHIINTFKFYQPCDQLNSKGTETLVLCSFYTSVLGSHCQEKDIVK